MCYNVLDDLILIHLRAIIDEKIIEYGDWLQNVEEKSDELKEFDPKEMGEKIKSFKGGTRRFSLK